VVPEGTGHCTPLSLRSSGQGTHVLSLRGPGRDQAGHPAVPEGTGQSGQGTLALPEGVGQGTHVLPEETGQGPIRAPRSP